MVNTKCLSYNFPQFLLLSDFRYTKYKWIYMKDVKDSKLYHRIIEKMGKAYPKASFFYIWNSNLSSSFFKRFSNNNWTIRGLSLHNCNIGNRLIDKLSMMNIDNLLELSIALDPFNNKILTSLMGVPLNKLIKLSINHTMVTTDGLRTLNKLVNGRISTISIIKQQRFNYTAILR